MVVRSSIGVLTRVGSDGRSHRPGMVDAVMGEDEAELARMWSRPEPLRTLAAVEMHEREFSTFYRGFVPTLVAFLIWQGVPLREAADIAQETMIIAYRQWSTIDRPAAWSRRVASRIWARRCARIVEDPVADLPESVGVLWGTTDIAVWEQRHEVLRILDLLPPRQRQVLAWTLDGFPPIEIAAELQMTPEAVRASLLKARRRLARYLRDAGGGP